MSRVTSFHKNINSATGSKLFNKEFKEIYWKIGREEFPEKVIMLQEIRNANLRNANVDFSDKTKSYQKSKLLKNQHYL